MRSAHQRFTHRRGALLAVAGLLAGSLPLMAAAPATAEVIGPLGERTGRVQPVWATPAPTLRPARPAPHGPGGSMAQTGAHGERLWLLGGLALALAGTGAVAKAALRGRRGD
ncbi:hypothetical protein [Streptomyces sp. NPDC093600]|uniref:hypothetical protein n=1 Tax=Streptomyces sp. NPDC093600 TaxID=3366047 RepID=UPI00382CB8E7